MHLQAVAHVHTAASDMNLRESASIILDHYFNGLDEGRSQAHPCYGHQYHCKSEDELMHIIKDAGEARDAANKIGDEKSENKYSDQMSDANTVLNFRRQFGGKLPGWYTKKYPQGGSPQLGKRGR